MCEHLHLNLSAQIPSKMKFTDNEVGKIDGRFSENDIGAFLWFCWLMEYHTWFPDLHAEQK